MSETETEADGERRETAARVRRGLDYALLGGLAFLGLVAAIQLYLAADQTINVWVTREFRPPFKMVFNLVVLLVVGVGLSRQVRRLTGGSDGDGGTGDSETDATADGGHVDGSTTTPDRPVSDGDRSDPVGGDGDDAGRS
jgi:hypothetical protein